MKALASDTDHLLELPSESSMEKGEWRRGFKVLASASLAGGMGYSLFLNTAGLFLVPVGNEFGWSRTAVSIGPIVGLCSAFYAPFAGLFIDRVGVRQVALGGMAGSVLFFIALALMIPSPLALYGLGVLIALASPFTSPGVFSKGVATWFKRNIGGALGISMSGVSVLFAVTTPIVAHVIAGHGWRAGYGVLAAIAGLIACPVLYFGFREAPRALAAHGEALAAPGMEAAAIFRDARFWLLLIFFFFACLSIGGYVNQLVPLMEGRGFTLESAALLGSTYYISIGVSRIAIGFLLDRFPPTMISAAAVALSAVGAVLLLFSGQNPSVSFATLAVAMIGLAHGAESDFIAFFIHRYFGLRNYTLLFGIYGGLMTGGGFALGGLVFAALYDHFGNYQAAIATSAAGFAIASVLMIVIGVVDGAMRRKRTTI